MRHSRLEEARKLLPRSLQSLEKRKRRIELLSLCPLLINTSTDLKTISRFAQLEYKLGDPERGKTIFEGIVDSHPKRLDLWSVYIDMEATQKDIAHIRFARLRVCPVCQPTILHRNLFGRILARKLTSHKAKYVKAFCLL
jgi:rRNA biogenesis protein RRP5